MKPTKTPILAFIRREATVQPQTLTEKVAALETHCPILTGVIERLVDKFLEGSEVAK